MSFGTLDDHKKMARDVREIGHYGNGDYEFTVISPDQIDYVISLARESYEKN